MAIKGIKKLILTPKTILDLVSEYDIYMFYMPHKNWEINEVTFSPFREEKHPSFLISNRNSCLSFIDFSDTSLRGDCFTFVKKKFQISNMDEVLRLIDRDMQLGISTGTTSNYQQIIKQYKQPENLEKRYAIIQVKTKPFTKLELEYWNEYGIDISELKNEKVYSVSKVYLNKKLFTQHHTEMTFGYLYEGGHWKIYSPFADKKNKWVPNNVPITAMDGKQNIQNCEFSFINKSKKDYMVTKKLIENSCAVQNEGIACFSEENVQYLKKNSNRQILSFDSDVTGVKNSQQITKIFDFDYCNVPRKYLSEGIKDWADLSKKRGLKTVEKIFKQKKLIQ